ncbi:MAG: hypothetical protein WA154_11525 [Moraxellaceae bacterium]
MITRILEPTDGHEFTASVEAHPVVGPCLTISGLFDGSVEIVGERDIKALIWACQQALAVRGVSAQVSRAA